MSINDVARSMILVVPGGYGKDEYDDLMEDYGVCERALQDLLTNKIDFEMYLDVLEDRGIEMDDYLTIVESNLDRLELV